MEIYFAYARLLKRKRDRISGQRSAIRRQRSDLGSYGLATKETFALFPPQEPFEPSENGPDLIERLRLASACHDSEH